MFLVMRHLREFLRLGPTTATVPRDPRERGPGRSKRTAAGNLAAPSSITPPKMSIYAKGVSVLMPGNDIPTYIAHPAPPPLPCPPDRVIWPPHHHIPIGDSLPSSS
ncbi:uncharacterized protein A4U43_C03F22170 [Asparagus officinalis]|uniref:Uncharacterized protein n=1 Tax=Asparagus officinalis TaxID=4686 RepID=A0A5P1FH74_ASPOF|nr:uncharacterized protein A4U43_C03F22170 [Asparagus officinalis]